MFGLTKMVAQLSNVDGSLHLQEKPDHQLRCQTIDRYDPLGDPSTITHIVLCTSFEIS